MSLLRDGLFTMRSAAALWGLSLESARQRYAERLHAEGSIGNTLVYRDLEVLQIAAERKAKAAARSSRLPAPVKDN